MISSMRRVSPFESTHALGVGTRLEVVGVLVGDGGVGAGLGVIADAGALDEVTEATGLTVAGITPAQYSGGLSERWQI